MVSTWKIGAGAGTIILGVYILFNQRNFLEVIFGIIAIAFGISLIASDSK
ncbi:hypothetical protein HYW75_06070 [Candidatus Pacearchaeota archaeon]|nr:hypothetical protein [Candidatus Pacearchaeota archaeon]